MEKLPQVVDELHNNGFKQVRLAEKTKIPESSISRYFTGEGFPAGKKLPLILDGMRELGVNEQLLRRFTRALVAHKLNKFIGAD